MRIIIIFFLLRTLCAHASLDTIKLMDLKKARITYESKKNSLERMHMLFQKELIAKNDFEQEKFNFQLASLEFQKKYLEILSENPYITIQRAIKFQDEEGKRYVKLILKNASDSLPLFEGLKLDKNIREQESKNIFASLKDLEGIIISRP